MKMPSNPTKRTKMMVVLVVVGGLLLYGLRIAVITPLNQRLERLQNGIKTAESAQHAAREYLRQAQARRLEHEPIFHSLAQRAVHPHVVLEPSLGNYELPARQRILKWATESGISPAPEVRGRPAIQPIRGNAQRRQPALLASYGTTVTFNTGLLETLQFLHTLETEFPGGHISKLTINADPETPRRHRINLEIEWPVWATEDAPETLANTMAQVLTETTGETP